MRFRVGRETRSGKRHRLSSGDASRCDAQRASARGGHRWLLRSRTHDERRLHLRAHNLGSEQVGRDKADDDVLRGGQPQDQLGQIDANHPPANDQDDEGQNQQQ
jgi:hypothetical protein